MNAEKALDMMIEHAEMRSWGECDSSPDAARGLRELAKYGERLRTELQQHQWRSIESAPMDGTELLLCWWCDLNGWQYEVAPYSNLDVARRGEGYCHGRATHFAYLPEPPEPDQ